MTELPHKIKPPGVEVSEQEGDVGSKAEVGEPQSSGWTASGFLVRSKSGVCLTSPLPQPSLLSPGTGVTVNALHPGVARTELGRHTGMHKSGFSSFTLGKCPPGLGPLAEALPSLLGAREPPLEYLEY